MKSAVEEAHLAFAIKNEGCGHGFRRDSVHEFLSRIAHEGETDRVLLQKLFHVRGFFIHVHADDDELVAVFFLQLVEDRK